MIRKTVAMSLILAAGICAYRGSSPYIEARMEQEYFQEETPQNHRECEAGMLGCTDGDEQSLAGPSVSSCSSRW